MNSRSFADGRARLQRDIDDFIDAGGKITLDGQEAIVNGWRRDWLRVCQWPAGMNLEFSDQAIAFVLKNREGAFTS